MFEHYIKTALRNIWRGRSAAAVSVLGLALGLMCFIAASGYGLIASNGDRHFAKSGRVQFIEVRDPSNTGLLAGLFAPWPLAEQIRAEFPELDAVARLRMGSEALGDEIVASANGRNLFVKAVYVDPPFLKIFEFDYVAGGPEALARPRSVLMTADGAQRLFGATDVVGRSLVLQGVDATVAAVIQPVQGPSHLARSLAVFDVMGSMDMHEIVRARDSATAARQESWAASGFLTYALLPEAGLTADAFNARLAALVKRVVPQEQAKIEFTSRPLTNLVQTTTNALLRSEHTGVTFASLMFTLGGMLLVVACVNYANLATAEVVGRGKEAGLRRTLGATNAHLLFQHLTETALKVVAACAIAFLLLLLALPGLSAAVGFDIVGFYAALPTFWLAVTIGLGSAILVAGFYPAVLMARLAQPSVVRPAVGGGRQIGRKLLVCVQFIVVSLLLIVSLVVGRHNQVMEASGPQATGHPLVVISNKLRDAGVTIDSLRAELTRSPHVAAVTGMAGTPWGFGGGTPGQFQNVADSAATPVMMNRTFVGEDFFAVFDIRLLSGRALASDRDTVDAAGANPPRVVVDATAAQQLGWTPSDAVGKLIYERDPRDAAKPAAAYQIVGVTENKPLQLMAPRARLNIYVFDSARAVTPIISLKSDNLEAATADIDVAWARLAPAVPLKRQFGDDVFRATFNYFSGVGAFTMALAVFGFLIAIAGVLGMATYTMQQRRREIGIRKTLGSTVGQVLRLILWSFSKPVVIATLVAWPLAFVVSRFYLGLFTTRAALTPLPFIISFVVILLVTWIVVGRQALRAAQVNPADVLHYE